MPINLDPDDGIAVESERRGISPFSQNRLRGKPVFRKPPKYVSYYSTGETPQGILR